MPLTGTSGWNDCMQLDTGSWVCRWHLDGEVKLVGCQHRTEGDAIIHAHRAAQARAALIVA